MVCKHLYAAVVFKRALRGPASDNRERLGK
jgi:hypothetical protein